MTPIKLIIEGLYSYRSRQTIDFETLCRARLFGIFGKVGSGKSSVLEAISYALYGETERLSKQDNRGYNMMNLQSDELFIDFEFSHPTPDDRYRFTVTNKRRKSDRTQTGTPKRLAYKWNGTEYTAIESADAEHILGINYDNFKRTVIIPQGKFMEFLQLKPAERTVMLKELFGLHQFELYNQAASLDKSNTEELNKLSGAMTALGQIDAAAIKSSQDELAELGQQASVKEAELKRAESELSILAAMKETAEKIAALEQDLSLKMTQKPEMETRRTFLAEYEQCNSVFAPIISTKSKTEKKLAELSKLVASRQANVLSTQQEYDVQTEQLAQLNAQLLHNEPDANKAADLETVVNIQRLQKTRDEAEARIAKGAVVLEEVKQKAATQQTALIAVNSEIDSFSTVRQQMQTLQSNKTVLLQYAMAEEKVQGLKKQIIDFEQQIAALRTENTQTLESQSISPDSFAQISNLISETKQSIVEKQAVKQQLAITANLSKLAGELHEGENCPVCGSTHHPSSPRLWSAPRSGPSSPANPTSSPTRSPNDSGEPSTSKRTGTRTRPRTITERVPGPTRWLSAARASP